MDIFAMTKAFPSEEKYSLTSQIVRSSRSVAANIAEGWGKRAYEQEFKRHLVYALGSLEETKSWSKFAMDCNYISLEVFEKLFSSLDEIGAKIYKLHANWKSRQKN